MKTKIVGIGEALWDMLPEGRKIGGAPANFAYHASRFGYDGWVVSAVGRDALGDELVAVFDEKQLNRQIQRVDFPTGTVQVTLDSEGIPQYDICEGVAWDNIGYDSELEALAGQTRCVVFGSLAQRNAVSRGTIVRFLRSMGSDDDTLRIFDINLRQHFYTKQVIDDSLALCNILKINDEELLTVSRLYEMQCVDLVDACRCLLERHGLKMVILTCGTNGSYIFYPGGMSYAATPKVKVADTVGAGDSFTAAFASAMMSGKMSVEEAHAFAAEVAAFVCTQPGAMPTLPAELTGRIK